MVLLKEIIKENWKKIFPPVLRGYEGLEQGWDQGQVLWGLFQPSLSPGSPPINPPALAPGTIIKRGGDAQGWLLCIYMLQEKWRALGTVLHAGVPKPAVGELVRKRDFLETFYRVEELQSCVSYPCEADYQLPRLFLTFGHIWSVFAFPCHHLTPCISLHLLCLLRLWVCEKTWVSRKPLCPFTWCLPSSMCSCSLAACTSHLSLLLVCPYGQFWNLLMQRNEPGTDPEVH